MEEENKCNDSDMCANDIWSIDISEIDDSNPARHSQNATLNIGSDDTSSPTTLNHTTTGSVSNNPQRHATAYTSKKPLWWKRQSGRKISSRQRIAIQEIQELGLQLKLPTASNNGIFTPSCQNTTCDEGHAIFHMESTETPGDSIQNRPQIHWSTIFPTYNSLTDEIWLEIGYGLGDNLLCLASTNTTEILSVDSTCNNNDSRTCRKFYVGAEMHKGGIGTICARIQSANQEKKYWSDFKLFDSNSVDCNSNVNTCNVNDTDTTMYSNVRLYMGDGIKLLPFVPDNSITAVLITFPDPFMGTNQASFRILQLDVLDQIRRVLVSPERVTGTQDESVEYTYHSNSGLVRPGGRLYLATDHFGFHQWSHEQVSKFNHQRMQQNETKTSTNSAPNDDNNTNVCSKPIKSIENFTSVEPVPDRTLWLPVISKYEQKGCDEGRKTCLSCWETQ